MNYPKMKILLVRSIFFAPLAVVLGQTSLTLQQRQGKLRGNVTLGGIGTITTVDLDTFERFVENCTNNFYLRQTDGMVTLVSVSVQVTNRLALVDELAATITGTPISFNESISCRTTNSALSHLQMAFEPIMQKWWFEGLEAPASVKGSHFL